MKAKWKWGIACLLVGVVIVATMIGGGSTSTEPEYQGKTVGVWFREYSGKEYYDFRMVRIDPAWLALKKLGSNAVPHLVENLQIGRFHSTYVRAFIKLPGIVQQCLPNPYRKEMIRLHAITALGDLGQQAVSATSELLQLLKNSDPNIRRAVLNALGGIHPDRKDMTKIMLQLGSEKRYADVMDIAQQTGWEGIEMTQLLSTILLLPDVSLRRKAINLLENAGAEAKPALPEVTQALEDSDHEVRYMAARAMQHIRPLTPQALKVLRLSLQDTNVMVQHAARRALQSNGLP